MNQMTTKILLAAMMIGILFACSKNTYNTKPTLKIKSISKNVVEVGESLIVQLEVTDKEGDVTDTLYFQKVRINQRKTFTIRDTLYFQIPDAPSSSDGIIQLDLDYNNYLVSAETPTQNDTLLFRFALKDKADNVSDTVTTSEPIVIIR
jgi:hypothetical protein